MPYKYKDWYSTYPRGEYWNDYDAIKNNANLIAVELAKQGYCRESIFAVMGNMEYESGLNPYVFEGGLSPEYLPPEEGGPYSPAYWFRGWGLVQWTPGANCWNWLTEQGFDHRDGHGQMMRLKFEYDNDLEWYFSEEWSKYPITWEQFKRNATELSIEELTECFMLNYLRPASYDSLPFRQEYALSWKGKPWLFNDRVSARFAMFFKKHKRKGLY